MIKLMVMVFIHIKMVQNMKDNGKMIYNMVKVLKYGMINLNILVHIKMEKNKVLVDMNGQINHILKENGMIIK